jgi:hypothetical protein
MAQVRKYLMAGILVVGVVVSFGRAQAQLPTPTPTPRPTPTPVRNVFLYSVKFLCGLQVPNPNLKPPQEPPVKPGNYATAINVHNFRAVPLCITKKAVIANPESQPQGPISNFRPFKLNPDGAFEIDCPDIVSLFPTGVAPPPFIKGFVEIQSRTQLSVTAVYTSQTCHTSPSTPGCTSLGELALEVVPEPSFIAPSTSGACGP